MVHEYKTYNALRPLSSSDIATLVAQGKADQIVTHMKAYEDQQKAIKEGSLKLARLTVKTNKADGLYIAHPVMKLMKGGCNFNKHMLPAVRALVTDDHLRNLVKEYFQTEGNAQIDTNVIEEFTAE